MSLLVAYLISCFFLVSRVSGYVCVLSQLLSNFATLWTVAHQASLSMEFSQREYWSMLPFAPPGDLLHPGIEPMSPALAGEFFTCPCKGSAAAAAAKLLQSCPTLCDLIDGSTPGSSVPWILQARILERVAISFSMDMPVFQ